MIDVSSYQRAVDWVKVKAAGHDRAYIKFGENFEQDPYAHRNVVQARAAGVHVGLYWFAHPSNSPLKEARWFLRFAHDYLHDGDLPPALDLEQTEGHGWDFLNEWKAAWFAAVDAEIDCRAAFYSYYAFWKQMTLFADRPVWGADLRLNFVPPKSWAVHQYSFTGKVDGISGHVDLDRLVWMPTMIGGA